VWITGLISLKLYVLQIGLFIREFITTVITADKPGKSMTTRQATDKGIFHSLPQQKTKEKSSDTGLTDSLIPAQEEVFFVDSGDFVTDSEQAGAWCGTVNDSVLETIRKTQRTHTAA